MEITNFKDMYIAELQELVSVEDQLAEGLLRMAGVASHPALKEALIRHREETQIQKERLDSILRKHGDDSQAHTDQAMQALVKETEKMLGCLKGNDLRDAGLIASAQKLEHYEIAAYGTAAALAGQLELRDDQQLLHESLEEEKRTDVALTQLRDRPRPRFRLSPDQRRRATLFSSQQRDRRRLRRARRGRRGAKGKVNRDALAA